MTDAQKAVLQAIVGWVVKAAPATVRDAAGLAGVGLINEVEDLIRAWDERYAIKKGTFDQFAAAQAMASRLNEDLSPDPDEPVYEILHKKASAVTDPAKELERLVKAGPAFFAHDGNPIMDWMASNVVVARRRDETLLPIKETPMSPMKIDGIDATINAIHPAVTLIPDDTRSYWDD